MKSVIEIYSDIAKKNPVWSPEEEIKANRMWYKDRDRWLNEAFNHNLGLMFKSIEKYAFDENKTDEDLYQIAANALITALRSYDPSKNIRISTWVCTKINWSIMSAQDAREYYGSISQNIRQNSYRSLKRSKKGWHGSVIPIESTVKNEEGCQMTIADTITVDKLAFGYAHMCGLDEREDNDRRRDIRMVVIKHMDAILTERECIAIKWMFSGLNLAETGKKMGVSRERVRQIWNKSFFKIRNSKLAPILKEFVTNQ